MSIDATPMLVGVRRWVLEKFDGEKTPGDGKRPVAILTGGDGLETRELTPDHPEFASFITDDKGDQR